MAVLQTVLGDGRCEGYVIPCCWVPGAGRVSGPYYIVTSKILLSA